MPELLADLTQQVSPSHSLYPPGGQLGELLIQLGSHEKAAQLFGGDGRRPRARERVEDEAALLRRGEQGPAHQAQGLLGRVVPVGPLAPGRGRYPLDGGDLLGGVPAVHEVVVEGVA